MSPKAPPDLDLRRRLVLDAARDIAEAEGWPAVTMRRLGGALGVTQPVLYTVFAGRQAIVDAVAVGGFAELAEQLEAVEREPRARMLAYLDFAEAHPRLYEAMFSLPTELAFATEDAPDELHRAFAALAVALPDEDGLRAEAAWSVVHGLATLERGGRLRPHAAPERRELLVSMVVDQAGGLR